MARKSAPSKARTAGPRKAWLVHPRPLGLDLVMSDAWLVAEAERELKKLLSDPYYREALRLLARRCPEIIRFPRGNLPPKGEWAAKRQWREAEKPKGRPPSSVVAKERRRAERLRLIYEAFKKRGQSVTIADIARMSVERSGVAARSKQGRLLVKRLAQRIYEVSPASGVS